MAKVGIINHKWREKRIFLAVIISCLLILQYRLFAIPPFLSGAAAIPPLFSRSSLFNRLENYQLSTSIKYQVSSIKYQEASIKNQVSTINYQESSINNQPIIQPLLLHPVHGICHMRPFVIRGIFINKFKLFF